MNINANTKATANADANVIYFAMFNLPGCLPEMEPHRTLSEQSARDFIAEEIEQSWTEDDGDEEAMEFVCAEIRRGNMRHHTLADGYIYTIDRGAPIDDEERRRAALAVHLDCDLGDVEPSTYGENSFEAEGGEYLVLDDDEADTIQDEYLDSYIDDCLEIPDMMKNYFDRDAWKRDAKMDGRGHTISGYDGNEEEIQTADGWLFIYRTN